MDYTSRSRIAPDLIFMRKIDIPEKFPKLFPTTRHDTKICYIVGKGCGLEKAPEIKLSAKQYGGGGGGTL